MKKYKIVEKKPINKHKHIIDKYTAYINLLEKKIQKDDCSEEDFQKYNDSVVNLMQKRDEYTRKILCLNAIEMAYSCSGDDRFFDLGEVLNNVFDFFVSNTTFSKDDINQRMESNLVDVSIVDEFPDNPTGIGYYSPSFGEMAIRADQINSEEVKLLLRHELTHVLGTQVINGKEVSGYSRSYNEDSIQLLTLNQKESVFSKLYKKVALLFNKQSMNNQFNEACVEMFARKDIPLKTQSTYNIWFFEKNIYTNFSEGSFYSFNANFVREIITARNISEDELFKGVFDYKSSEKVIKKIGGRTFKKISQDMEKLYIELGKYNDFIEGLFDKYYDSGIKEGEADIIFERCTPDELKEKDEAIQKIENKMASMEKMIIDKILLKKLKKLDSEERKNMIDKFSKFVICQRDYFEKTTGYKYMKDDDKIEQTRMSQYRVEVGELDKITDIKKENLSKNRINEKEDKKGSR